MLIDCCRDLNIPVKNLGKEPLFTELKNTYPATDNWKELSEGATRRVGLQGGFLFMHKLFGVYHYLKNNKTKKYVSFFDQSDTYLVDSPSERINEFKSMNCEMLFNAETKCMYWPMAVRQDSELYPKVNKFLINYGDVKKFEEETYSDCRVSNGHKFCYLNSGGFITSADYYVHFFEKYLNFMLETIHFFDQTIMHHFHRIYYPEIKIDHKCEVLQCTGPNVVEFNL
tara:strand:+ start:2452 stop:3132 length:681 start_codon:yes stop_codon:yes gene_type:complete